MNKITEEDKKLFFDNIHYIQKKYNELIKDKGFDYAEKYKQEEIRKYLKINKEALLCIHKKIIEEEC